MKKLLAVIIAAMALCLTTRADSIETLTTTESVTTSIGCWNPAVCGDPSAYWNAWDLPLPSIEPPANDFSPITGSLYNWNESAMQYEYWPTSAPVATPEPETLALLVVGLLLLGLANKVS